MFFATVALPFLCPVTRETLLDQIVAFAVRTANFSGMYHCLLFLDYKETILF
jgi:hypothetical protein